MAGDSLGKIFRITNWGESHGKAIGVVIEGVPPGLSLSQSDIQQELDRRRPGQSSLSSPRNESDSVQILSGLEAGKTTGTPLSMYIANSDTRPKDYTAMNNLFRPSHADFTYFSKYGIRSKSGGGRSSARLTAGSVAAGAVAKKILQSHFKVSFMAFVRSLAKISSPMEASQVSKQMIEANLVRTTDSKSAEKMAQCIEEAKHSGDSLGGIIECHIHGLPAGLGEPIYDKLDADLAKAMLSINACKGFEIGSGFSGTRLRGSEHNDQFIRSSTSGEIKTLTNHSGGVQGGISNGMPIVFRVAFKPTASISKTQHTLNEELQEQSFQAKGRHDPCVLPRAVPIVEAMAALVLADHMLRHRAQIGTFYKTPANSS